MAEQLKKGSKLLWYRIDSILGRGGFGITYLATDTNLETQVAIKEYLPGEIAERKQDSYVLPKTGTDGEMYRWGLTRFIEEARILAKFKHHNIVRVHSVFEENNTAYMVMEYEHGNNLDLMLRTPQYQTEERLVELFDAILSGLGQVHDHNIIHRDIKPANIYIREDGSPVLLDFGSARQHVADKSQNMTRILTKGYAPYEQMDDTGAARQGPWTDIYAIGATLYYAISRKLPTDCLSRFTRVIQKQPDPLTPAVELETQGSYSPEFLFAIDQALHFDSADRPQSVTEFRELLRAGIDKSPRSQPTPVPPPAIDPDATVLAVPSRPAEAVNQPDSEKTRFSQEFPVSPADISDIHPPAPSAPVTSSETTAPSSRHSILMLGGGALLASVLLGGGFMLFGGGSLSTDNQVEALSEDDIVRLEQLAAKRKQLEAERAKEEKLQREAERLAEEENRLKAEQLEREQQLAKQQVAEEKKRLEAEKAAAEKLAAEKKQAEQNKAKAERERIESEQRIAAEKQRLEQEQQAAEQARLEEERLANEREQKRLIEEAQAQRSAELKKLEQQRLEEERQLNILKQQRELAAKQRLEEEEKLKQDQARLEELKRIEQEEQERLAKLEAEEKIAAQKAEATRIRQEKALAAQKKAEAEKRAADEAKKVAAAKKAKISPVALKEYKKQETESDMQSISRLFNEFRIQLASCDTTALGSTSKGQKSSIGFVKSLCSEYSNMDISIRNFQSNVRRGVASADVTIQKLTSKSGDTVLPSKSWNTLPIKTLKSKDGFWQFVEW